MYIRVSFLSQSQELLAWIEEASSSVPEGGPTFVYSTYVIDCVRPEDQGFKYCVTFSKNTVEIAATALLVNSKRDNDISPNGHCPQGLSNITGIHRH